MLQESKEGGNQIESCNSCVRKKLDLWTVLWRRRRCARVIVCGVRFELQRRTNAMLIATVPPGSCCLVEPAITMQFSCG